MTAEKKPAVKLGGKNFYYVAIDGTDSVDSAMFGVEIEKYGFRNLFGEMLKDNKSPDDAARVVDPNHPFLPIWKVVPKLDPKDSEKSTGVPDAAKGIAVVCPMGLNSSASDTFWQGYGIENGIEESSKFMEQLILKPAVVFDWKNKTVGIATGAEKKLDTVLPAHILTLSSHGWLGGFMTGNSTTLRYADGHEESHPKQNWMIIGGVADRGRKFEGPVWLILAQCSTVCMATWPSWVQVMARSSPPVRGIVAYEEVAPAAGTAANIAKQFFARMKDTYASGPNKGKPISFVDAWRYVNENAKRHWAAIVHKDALLDSLSNFHEQAPIDVSDPLNGAYLGYSETHDKAVLGQPITIKEPPFKLELAMVIDTDSTRRRVIDEKNLDQARLMTKYHIERDPKTKNVTKTVRPIHYEVKFGPPSGVSGVPILEATLEWVHIRLSKPKFDSKKLFQVPPTVPDGVKVTYEYKPPKCLFTFKVDKAKALTELVVRFDGVESFDGVSADENYKGDDKIIAHHSYLWLRASLKLDGGHDYEPFDFTTRGLIYYGGEG